MSEAGFTYRRIREAPPELLLDCTTRPEHLVWTEPEAGITTTITFTGLGDGRTEVITHQVNVPEAVSAPWARERFPTSLDRFGDYVASLAAGRGRGSRSGSRPGPPRPGSPPG